MCLSGDVAELGGLFILPSVHQADVTEFRREVNETAALKEMFQSW